MPNGADKRFNPEGRKYQIQRLWNIHHEICRYLLLGWQHTEIAAELGISEAMVSYVANSAIVKQQLEIMRGARDADTLDLAIEIRKWAPECLALLQHFMRDDNVSYKERIAIAKDGMDRAGFAPPKVLEARHLHAYFSAEEIEDMKRRARESEQVVDAEVVKQLES